MDTTDAHPAIVRRRGNPNWGSGRPAKLGPTLPTEFEMQVRQLQLTPETYVFSQALHSWCERNRNQFYIPEWLIKAWNLRINDDLTGAA